MYKSIDVVQVNIPAESGDMGLLANHVPSIEQLKPGLIEVIEESGGSKQFFRKSQLTLHSLCCAPDNCALVSGGFAVMQPNSELSINAVEGYPLEDFSAENVRSQLAEAQKIVNGSGSEQDIAEAKIELEVSSSVAPTPESEVLKCAVGFGESASRTEVERWHRPSKVVC